jgi:hypothetical protein
MILQERACPRYDFKADIFFACTDVIAGKRAPTKMHFKPKILLWADNLPVSMGTPDTKNPKSFRTSDSGQSKLELTQFSYN